MAKKANFMQPLQENRRRGPIAERKPPPPAAALYLMRLRASAQNATRKISAPQRRLSIAVEHKPGAEISHPVKIKCAD